MLSWLLNWLYPAPEYQTPKEETKEVRYKPSDIFLFHVLKDKRAIAEFELREKGYLFIILPSIEAPELINYFRYRVKCPTNVEEENLNNELKSFKANWATRIYIDGYAHTC